MAEKNETGGKVDDAKTVVVDYAKQELVDPIKPLGKWVGLGVAGAVCWGVGLVLISLGILRALQTETWDWFDGNLTFVPYLITLIFLGVIAALTFTKKLKG